MPQSEFRVHQSIDAGVPFDCQTGGACLEMLKNRYGVYIFQHVCTHDVLYVGKAHEQWLNVRIMQHYRPRDTGGNFRINFCKKKLPFGSMQTR